LAGPGLARARGIFGRQRLTFEIEIRRERSMGLMDKMKEQANVLTEKGKQGVAQGQAKLDAMSARKQLDALFHDLGEATYAAERKGADRAEVDRLLTAIDEHESANAAEAD
jgi:hypothetical protein